VLVSFAENITPAFGTPGRAGDSATLDFAAWVTVVDAARLTEGSGSVGDFAAVAAEEPAGVFVEPSVPDFTFFCRCLR
jgi:hypothetical protein